MGKNRIVVNGQVIESDGPISVQSTGGTSIIGGGSIVIGGEQEPKVIGGDLDHDLSEDGPVIVQGDILPGVSVRLRGTNVSLTAKDVHKGAMVHVSGTNSTVKVSTIHPGAKVEVTGTNAFGSAGFVRKDGNLLVHGVNAEVTAQAEDGFDVRSSGVNARWNVTRA